MDYSTLGTVDISQGMTAGGRPTGASSAPLGVVTDLDSIRDLAAAQEKDVHEGLCDLLKNHTLVGMVRHLPVFPSCQACKQCWRCILLPVHHPAAVRPEVYARLLLHVQQCNVAVCK